MPVFEDWLKDPLSIINNIFASDPINFDSKVQEYFENKLKSEKNYFSIPCLNDVSIHELTPNCLVRYRCMIQDMFDPIYYYAVNQIKLKNSDESQYVTFKYKEILDTEDFEVCNRSLKPEQTNDQKINFLKNEQQNLHQRMTFYCVPIPGETEWIKCAYKSISSQSSGLNGSSSNTSHRPSKRAIDQANEKMDQMSDEKNDHLDENNPEDHDKLINKKSKIDETEKNQIIQNNDITLNFPLSTNETGLPCLVKVYENFDSFKINDIVEFVGILSQDPSLAYMHDEHTDAVYMSIREQQIKSTGNEENSMETDQSTESNKNQQVLSSFPPSLVPRLNCIKSYHLIHNNPLLNRFDSNTSTIKENQDEKIYWKTQLASFLTNLTNENNREHNNSSASNKLTPSPFIDAALLESSKVHLLKIRQELVNCFQVILLGDNLAAEYLLMHLLSSVFMRKDVTVLGKFSLNLTNVPQLSNSSTAQNYVSCFYKAINQFVSMSHLYQLTVDNLNKSNFIPSKDYNKEKLISGMLQLPEQFQLVIDETCLNSGELKEKGLLNISSIREIIQWQKLNYDFSYHQQEFHTNIRLLIFSETKSILPFDCQLKLKTSSSPATVESYEKLIYDMFENKHLLENFRRYLCILTKQEYKIAESLQKIVEDDIVHIRKDFAANVKLEQSNGNNHTERALSVEDIHLLLIVARLQCLSYAQSELDINHWNKAKSLEFERLHTRL